MAKDALDIALEQFGQPATESTEQTIVGTTESTTGTTAEQTQPTQTTETQTQQTPISEFSLEHFNKKFGREFKTEAEITSLFDLPTKITEFETKLSEFDKIKAEQELYKNKYEEVGKYVDPKSFFANEKLYQTNLMLKKYPDKDVALMTKISQLDVDKADSFDLLVMNEMLINPDIEGGEVGARELLASEFGIDPTEKSTWDTLAKNKIAKEATKVRGEFKTLQTVDPQLPIDVEKVKADMLAQETAKFEQGKSTWKPLVEKMVSDFKDLTVFDVDDKGNPVELYKISVDYSDSERKAISTGIVDYLAYTGQEVNESTVGDALEMMKGRYASRNQARLLKEYGAKIATDKDAEWHNKVHNIDPLSQQVADSNQSQTDVNNWTSFVRGK